MIDLHLHSTCSDGTMSPGELVSMAARTGLSAIAITDHDTVAGTEEALEEGIVQGVSVISGLELSVAHKGMDLHLLCYDFDWKNKTLLSMLKRLQSARLDRNDKILGILNKMGIAITAEELSAESGGGLAGRPHIARLLVKKGCVKTMNEAFSRYLKKNACAYVRRFVLDSDEAINLAHMAHGLAVLAHPIQLGYSLENLPTLLENLKLLGLDGVECYYPTQKGKIQKKISKLAERFDLLQTGGSDYHGDIRPGTSLAGSKRFSVPLELFERLMKNRKPR